MKKFNQNNIFEIRRAIVMYFIFKTYFFKKSYILKDVIYFSCISEFLDSFPMVSLPNIVGFDEGPFLTAR